MPWVPCAGPVCLEHSFLGNGRTASPPWFAYGSCRPNYLDPPAPAWSVGPGKSSILWQWLWQADLCDRCQSILSRRLCFPCSHLLWILVCSHFHLLPAVASAVLLCFAWGWQSPMPHWCLGPPGWRQRGCPPPCRGRSFFSRSLSLSLLACSLSLSSSSSPGHEGCLKPLGHSLSLSLSRSFFLWL